MDEILQRVLRIEQEAEKRLQAARDEAQGVMEQGRRDVAEMEERGLAELTTEAESLIASRVADAEKERQTALESTQAQVNRNLTAFRKRLDSQAAFVLDALAYPLRPQCKAAFQI